MSRDGPLENQWKPSHSVANIGLDVEINSPTNRSTHISHIIIFPLIISFVAGNVKCKICPNSIRNSTCSWFIFYAIDIGFINCIQFINWTLHIFRCDSFCKWKDNNMWDVGWTVGRWVDCDIKFNVCNCVDWLSQVFQRTARYDVLLWFPASGWTRNFRLDYIELSWVSLNDYK